MLALAVAGPVGVWAGWLWAMGALSPSPEVQGEAGPVGDPTLAAALADEPEIVVFGNSQADSGVLADVLAARAGQSVGKLTRGGVRGPTTYAMLKHGVFGQGHRPELVLVVMNLPHLLWAQLPPVDVRPLFEAVGGNEDPVLQVKILGQEASLGDDVLTAARAWRDDLLTTVTSLPTRWLTDAPDPAARMARARETALSAVQSTNYASTVRMIPIVEPVVTPRTLSDSAVGDQIEASLVPDLVAAAQEAGARLVFVTLPQNAAELSTPGHVAGALEAWLAPRGVGFVNLETMDFPPSGWKDRGHMTDRGAERYTEALVEALDEIGAFQSGPLQRSSTAVPPPRARRWGALPPLPTEVTWDRDGEQSCEATATLPALEALSDGLLRHREIGLRSPLRVSVDGEPLEPHAPFRKDERCVGRLWHAHRRVLVSLPRPGVQDAQIALGWDARLAEGHADPLGAGAWVPPGTSLELAWDALPDRVDPRLELVVSDVLPGAGTPRVRFGDGDVDVTREGNLWLASADAGDASAWRWTVTSPPDGPWLYVRQVVAQGGEAPAWLLGHPRQRLRALTLAGFEGGRIEAPSTVPLVTDDAVVEGGWVRLALPTREAGLTIEALTEASGDAFWARRCVPLTAGRLVEGVFEPVRFTKLADGLAVAKDEPPGSAWQVRGKDRRRCFERTWVLPGETVTVSPYHAGAIEVAATTLELHASVLPAPSGEPLRLVVTGPDGVVLDRTVPWPEGSSQTVQVPLDRPLPPAPSEVTLSLTVPGDGPYLLVHHAQLL